MNSLWMKRWLMVPAALGMAWGLGTMPSLKAQPAPDQPLIEESGRIEPAKATYSFVGSADQRITIILDSGDFDPVVMLQDDEGNEIASNDDFGGSLNSKLIVSLPADGEYQVVATSYDGQGGDYDLTVRPANPYESLYGEGQDSLAAEKYDEAIAAYSAAIDLEPEEVPAYLGRIEAYLGQVYAEAENVETPADIPADTKSLIIADFEQAADLIEALGNLGWAQSLREQADVLRGIPAESESDA
ncbi:hypothetical protein C7271_25650 [filamentous cyanobacterium CCP5]|nr:hypothetical protein C7271_25650 [filamentous cyanobacterium CCP5]